MTASIGTLAVQYWMGDRAWVKGGGGFLFLGAWVLVIGYAVVAVAGAVLVAALAVIELRRSRPGPPVNRDDAR